MFAHFQDFVDGYVGPFATEAELLAHVEFCRERGDSSEFMGIVAAVPPGAQVTSPEDDRAWVSPT